MLRHTDQNLLGRRLTVFLFHLLLMSSCRGQPQLIGSSQPVVATLGEDVVLPCFLRPAADASDLVSEWTRPDLNPRFVLVWRTGQDLEGKKHEAFVGRTSLFVSELNVGNISLKLSGVKLSDEGTYRCFVLGLGLESFVPLVVGSNVVSSPVVTLAGIDRNRGGVVLHCGSKGWYPEPEVSWLDSEGHVLSAGPTETVRGPDGLYTVSSRVTVEKRHSNNFTCRVQQKDINQIRETQIHVPDDFFELQSSSSAVTAGFGVTLTVCILIILLFVFLFWRQNRIKIKRGCLDLTDEEEKEGGSKEEREREPLRTDGAVQKEEKDKKGQKKNKYVQIKQTDLQQLHEEKKRNQGELKNLKEQLENKEVERVRAAPGLYDLVSLSADGKSCEANEELKRTREELEEKSAKLDQIQRHVDELRAAEQKLREEKQKLEQLNKELETKNKELEKKLQEERKKREKAEEELKNLKKKVEAFWSDECKSGASVNLQRDETNSVSSTTGLVIEVVQEGKFFHLRNTSSQEQPIGGWTLQIQIKDREPIKHKLKNPLKLSPGQIYTISGPNYSSPSSPSDLVLVDLKPWSPRDKLQVVLIRDTGETHHLPVHRH